MNSEISNLKRQKEEFKKNLEFAKVNKKKIELLVSKLLVEFRTGKISREEYENRLFNSMGEKTVSQWLKYYDDYINYYNSQIDFLDHLIKEKKSKSLNQKILFVIASLIILSFIASVIFLSLIFKTEIIESYDNILDFFQKETLEKAILKTDYLEKESGIEISDYQYPAIIGKKVLWKSQILIDKDEYDKEFYDLNLPVDSKLVSISDEYDNDLTLNYPVKTKRFLFIFSKTSSLVRLPKSNEKYFVYFETSAPVIREQKIVQENKKLVKVIGSDYVHYENVLTRTLLPREISEHEKNKVQINRVKNENGIVTKEKVLFNLYDSDLNSLYDTVEWITPYLSEAEFEILIINITKAEHLDLNRNLISDIYPQLRFLDNNWSEKIYHNEYVRVNFERNLTNKNDLTIYARNLLNKNTKIEVYLKDFEEKIAEFPIISEEKEYKIYLTNMTGEYSNFDLKIINLDTDSDSYLEFDYIVDPAIPVSNCNDLQNINNLLSGIYYLTEDIDCSSFVGFVPIGTSVSPFRGKLYGQGHIINNININSNNNYAGLFGYLSSAEIYDLGISNVNVSGLLYVGGLAGYATGSKIINSFVKSSSNSNRIQPSIDLSNPDYYGGLVGSFNFGTINDSYADINIYNGNSNIGGLVGYFYASSLYNSYFSGIIQTEKAGQNIGCLIGYGYIFDVLSSYSACEIFSAPNAIRKGAFIGRSYTPGSVNNNYCLDIPVYSCVGYGSFSVNIEDNFWDYFNKNHAVYVSGSSVWDFNNVWKENNPGSCVPPLPLTCNYPTLKYETSSTKPPINLNSCQELFLPNRKYVLTANLNIDATSSFTCMNITAQNVTLDCQGRLINIASSNNAGNVIHAIFSAYSGTVINNCSINSTTTTGTLYGIRLKNSNYSQIYNSKVYFFSTNLYSTGSSHLIVKNSNLTFSRIGINELIFEFTSINNSFVNSSYSYIVYPTSSYNFELIRKWYFRVKVVDTLLAGISNAIVRARDVFGNDFFTFATDSNGYTPISEIIDYVDNRTDIKSYSDYQINATNTSFTDSAYYNASNGNNLEFRLILSSCGTLATFIVDLLNKDNSIYCGDILYNKTADVDKNGVITPTDAVIVTNHKDSGDYSWCSDRLIDPFDPCDSTPPVLTIVSPLNNSNFNSTMVVFNVSSNENLNWCGLSIDNNPNITMAIDSSLQNAGHIQSGISNGNHNFIISCNDSSANFAFTNRYYFSVDIIYPTINVISPINNSINPSNVLFNVSSSETGIGMIIPNLDDSLVSWWRMDDVLGNNVNDYMGRNSGTNNGALQVSNGKFGKARSFDGINDYIDLPTSSVLEPNEFSISAWMNPRGYLDPSLGKWKPIIEGGGNLNTRTGYYLGFNGWSTTFDFRVGISSSWNLVQYDRSNIPLNSWTHVVATYGAFGGAMYINGVLVGTSTYTPPVYDANGIAIGTLGYSKGASGHSFNGTIDEVMFFNRSLSSSEVLGLYNATKLQFLQNLPDGKHNYSVYVSDLASNVNYSGLINFNVNVLENCRILNEPNRIYKLAKNIINNTLTSNCINIFSQNISLDCQGFYISSDDNYNAIYSNASKTKIMNCNLSMTSTGSGSGGIFLNNSADSSFVFNNTIYSNSGKGLFVYNSNNHLLFNNTVSSNSSNAFEVYNSDNNNISLNKVLSNYSIALNLNLSHNNSLSYNIFSSNQSYGLYVYNCSNLSLDSNIGTSNATAGIELVYGFNNTFKNNFGIGKKFSRGIVLQIQNSSFVFNNTAISENNASFKISSCYNSLFLNNTGNSSTDIGVYIISSFNSSYINLSGVSSNLGISGIYIRSSNNNFFRNIFSIGSLSFGIYFQGPNNNDNTLYNPYVNVTRGSSFGFYFQSTNNTRILDCSFISSTEYNVFLDINSKNNSFVNCSYNSELVASGGQLIRKWYYLALVNDSSGKKISGANFSAYNVIGQKEFSVITNATGWINQTEITEYVNTGLTSSYSNYTLNATNISHYGTKQFNLSALPLPRNKLDDFITLNLSTLDFKIVFVQNIPSISPLGGSMQNVSFNFTIYHSQGYDKIVPGLVRAKFSKDNVVRENISCYSLLQDFGSYSNYSCKVGLWYFDSAGYWNVSVSANDSYGNMASNTTTSFYYNYLCDHSLSSSHINWTNINLGMNNQLSDDNISVSNLGNQNITLIKINATRLNGTVYKDQYILSNNFSYSVTNPCFGSLLSDNQNSNLGININYTDSSILFGSSNKNLSFCLKQLYDVELQQYLSQRDWYFDVVCSLALISFKRTRKKRKFYNLKKEPLLEKIEDRLKKYYGISVDELLSEEKFEKFSERKIISGYEADKMKKITVPLEIFYGNVGGSEILCKFLKENCKLKFSEISRILNRDSRTVWLNYNNQINKPKLEFDPQGKLVPVEIFSDRRLSILESLVLYLRNLGLKNKEIAKMLGKDQRNISTFYSRAVKNLKQNFVQK
jgi:parallel beta-helix repeat protein